MPGIDRTIFWHVYPLGFTDAPIHEPAQHPDGELPDGELPDGGYPDGGYPDGELPDGGQRPSRLAHLTDWLDYARALGTDGLLLGPVFAARTHGYDTLDHLRIDPRLGTIDDFDALVAAAHERGQRVVLDGVFNHVSREHPWFRQALREGPEGPYAAFFRIDWTASGGPRADVFEGHDSLVTLNHDEAAVADAVSEIMNFWLDRGIAGWRLDAAYAVDPGFWARVLPGVRARHPEAWIVGEVIHGDYAGIVEQTGMDSVTQYELWKAIWSSLVDRNFFELDWNLTRHNEFLERFTPNTFIGNHDVTRIATRVGPSAAVLALVVLMTTGGIPSIYYGDEQGYTGLKEDRIGGDDAVRPAFPDGPDGLDPGGAGMYRTHQELIALRREHPWLTTARTKTVRLDNTRYEYLALSADGEHSLTVELELDTPRVTVQDASGRTLFAR